MPKSIEQIKAAFKYEKEKMHKRLQVKEESLKIHIEEMDRLRKENNRLQLEIDRILESPICPHCHKYKRFQGNGMMHQLCECGVITAP